MAESAYVFQRVNDQRELERLRMIELVFVLRVRGGCSMLVCNPAGAVLRLGRVLVDHDLDG